MLAPPRTSRERLTLLGVVSLIAPVVLLIESLAGKPVDAAAVADVAGVMFLLVVLRISGLVRAHQQAMTREQVLRRGAAELVGAPGRSEIHEATISAGSELVGSQAEVCSISLAMADAPGVFSVVACSGAFDDGQEIDPASLPAGAGETLTAGRVVRCAAPVPEPGRSGREPASCLFVCPLVTREVLRGLIVVRSSDELPTDLTNALETLAAQVGLALDREVLTEALHARRSEARFQTLVQNASDVILIARPDTTVTYQTPSAQRILGYGPGSLEGLQLTSLLHPNDVEQAVYIDDAHGFGIIGGSTTQKMPYGYRGNSIVRFCGESYDNIVLVAGFSKAYSSWAAFLALPTSLKNYLKVAASPYLYSGPSPTASLATVLGGFNVNDVEGDDIRRSLCQKTARVLDQIAKLGLRTLNSSGYPVIELPLGRADDVDAVGKFLFDRGIYVTLAPYPLVPRTQVGFRVEVTAANDDGQID